MQQEGTYATPGVTIPAVSVDDACLHAEAKLREVSRLLLDIRPEAVERCQSELQQVIAALERLVSAGLFQANPRASATLVRIRRSARALRLQIEYASNLYFGWIQQRLGTGYTRQGLPVLAAREPGSSFEA
jgi:hypothetical protein